MLNGYSLVSSPSYKWVVEIRCSLFEGDKVLERKKKDKVIKKEEGEGQNRKSV